MSASPLDVTGMRRMPKSMFDALVESTAESDALEGAMDAAYQPSVRVVMTANTSPKANEHHTYVGKNDGEWDHLALRDWVIDQIESVRGVQPRLPAPHEAQLMLGFMGRWGDLAIPIARYAFDVCGGVWMGKPIAIERFAQGSDPYFAKEISRRLVGGLVKN